jgi:hypothetical protein
MHNNSRIAAVAAFARGSNGGLIVTGSALALVLRDLIITLATLMLGIRLGPMPSV